MLSGIHHNAQHRGNTQGIVCILLFLPIVGMILIALGMQRLSSSQIDQRSLSIDQYNKAVNLWNNGKGKDETFQNLDIHANFQGSAAATSSWKVPLVGQTTSQTDIQWDSPQNAAEVFTTTINPWHYFNEVKSAKFDPVVATLSFTGASVHHHSQSIHFYPLIKYDTPYYWNCHDDRMKSSSSTTRRSSNSRSRRRRGGTSSSRNNQKKTCWSTCNNPNSTDVNQDVNDCPEWCRCVAFFFFFFFFFLSWTTKYYILFILL